MHMGEFELSLNVKSLKESLDFYEKMGFVRIDGDGQTWALLGNGKVKIGLYQGHIQSNLLTFWSSNVYEKASKLKECGISFETEPTLEADGTVGATLLDPDGNRIYLQANEEECR